MANTAPGWYPDPSGGTGLRWHNGNSWIDHYRPAPAPEPATDNGQRRLTEAERNQIVDGAQLIGSDTRLKGAPL